MRGTDVEFFDDFTGLHAAIVGYETEEHALLMTGRYDQQIVGGSTAVAYTSTVTGSPVTSSLDGNAELPSKRTVCSSPAGKTGPLGVGVGCETLVLLLPTRLEPAGRTFCAGLRIGFGARAPRTPIRATNRELERVRGREECMHASVARPSDEYPFFLSKKAGLACPAIHSTCEN